MKRLFLLAVVSAPLFLFAQKNFQPGYIVRLTGDTSRGFIDYREWDKSPTEVVFKPDKGDQGNATFDVNSIRYFEVSDKEAYQRFIAKISLDPVAINDVGEKDTSSKIDTVFMKVLFPGKVSSLFLYTDIIKDRFFILEGKDERADELIYREYFKGDDRSHLIVDDTYKNQLNLMAYRNKNTPTDIFTQIRGATYTASDLIKLVYKLNGIDEKEAKKIAGNSPSKTRYFVGVGLQKNDLLYEGDQFFAKHSSNEATLSPVVSAGVDLFLNPYTRQLVFRLETGYRTNAITTTGSSGYNTESVYELSMNSFSIHPQILYNIFNLPNLKVPVGIGFGYTVSSYKKNTLKEHYTSLGSDAPVRNNYFALNKGNVSFLARAGVVVINKIEASVVYYPSIALTRYYSYSVSNRSIQFSVAYLFANKTK